MSTAHHHPRAALVLLALAATLMGCAAGAPRPLPAASLDGQPHLSVRVEAGAVWAGARAWTEPRHAWALPSRGPVEWLRVRTLPGRSGFEVTFEQGGSVWRGELRADRRARGPLSAVGWPPAGPDRETARR